MMMPKIRIVCERCLKRTPKEGEKYCDQCKSDFYLRSPVDVKEATNLLILADKLNKAIQVEQQSIMQLQDACSKLALTCDARIKKLDDLRVEIESIIRKSGA